MADDSMGDARRGETFDSFCRQLRRNNVTDATGIQVDIDCDAAALHFAFSLARNKTLVRLILSISPAEITNSVAKVLGRAIQKSAIKSLAIISNDDVHEEYPAELTDRMWRFYSKAITNINSLKICYDLGDKDAMRLAWLLYHKKLDGLVELHILLGNLTEELTVKALSKGIQNSAITHLSIGNATPQVCRMLLSTGVLNVPTLRQVDMNLGNCGDYDTSFLEDESVFENLNVQAVTACLQQASKLEEMVLYKCYLKDEDTKLLASAMLGNQNMKVLCLYGGFITDEGVASLAESCESCLQFVDLDLSENKIGVAGLLRLLKGLSDHPSWKALCLDGNANIGSDGLGNMDPTRLSDGINRPFQLPHDLGLRDCGLTPKDLAVLFSEKFCSKKLKSLDLGSNHFGDDVAAMLADFLSNKGLMLEELTLSDNQFTANGVQKLVRLTSTHPSLKLLDVSLMDVGYPGLIMIAEDLPTSKLTRFYISGNYDNEDDADTTCPRAVAKREAGTTAGQAFFNAVKSNMYLQKLDLCDMYMPDKMKRDICFFLELEKSGRQLLRLNDGLHPLGLWSHVLAKCSNNSSVVLYLLGEQPVLFIPTFGNLVRSKGCSTIATTNDSGKRLMALAESGPFSLSVKKTRVD